MKNNFKTIDEVICEYLDKSNRRTKKIRGNDYWSASSLGKCKRNQVLSRAGAMTNGLSNYSWKNAAKDGHTAHEWRQEALKKMGVLIAKEKSVVDEALHYRGHYDLIVNLSGKLVLGDIKTQKNRAFRARARMPGGIDPHHKKQLGSYFYFLKRDTYPELDSARLYYINRETCEREEIEVYFSDKDFEEIINELKFLNACWDNNILPKKEPSYFCKCICPFEKLCTEVGNKRLTKLDETIQRSFSDTTK